MDNTVLEETQNAQVSCRSTASNTTPIGCAFCGSNDYVQTSNCLRPCCPGILRFRQSSDNCGDNFSMHQPLFSSPPLLQSFFQNSSIPGSVFFTQNNLGSNIGLAPTSDRNFLENLMQMRSENENIPKRNDSCNGYVLNQECQTKGTVNNEVTSDGANQKSAQGSDHTSQFLKDQSPCQNPLNLLLNLPYAQQCMCKNSVPWSSSPFIVPIISYYVMWNSQHSQHLQPLPNNLSCSHSKNVLPKENNNVINQEIPDSDLAKREFSKETNQDNRNGVENLNVGVKTSSEVIVLVEKNLRNSCSESNNDYNEEIQAEMRQGDKEKSIEETVPPCENDLENEFTEPNDLQISPPSSLPIDSDLTTDLYVKANFDESQLSMTYEPIYELKRCENEVDVFSSTIQVKHYDIPSEGANTSFILREKYSKNGKKSKSKERRTLKKLIKSFTMADQMSHSFDEKLKDGVSVAAAAAGDLGVGWKVPNSPPNHDQHEIIQLETQSEKNLKSKDVTAKISRTFKSGIARSVNLKQNEPKPEDLGVSEQINKILRQKETTIVKRKHNCNGNENLSRNCGKSLKIQKNKNFPMDYHHIRVLESSSGHKSCKQDKTSVKEKRKTVKVQMVADKQKYVKSGCTK